MKKIITIILTAVLTISMAACSVGDPESTKEGIPMVWEGYGE